jgi:hypothetical protein
MAAARVAGMQAIWRRDPNVTLMVEADAVIEELGDPSHVGGARTNWLQQLISPLEARLRFARLLQRS